MPLLQLEATCGCFGCPIIELRGMTEIAGLGTIHPLYAPEKLGSIGLPLPFAQCKIAKLDNPVDEAAVGEFGEFLCREPTTTRGYYGKELETAEVLLPDGWLETGDIAYPGREQSYAHCRYRAAGHAPCAVDVHFMWRPQLADPADELVLEAAVNGRASAIVTPNMPDFLPAALDFEIEVIPPSVVLQRMRK